MCAECGKKLSGDLVEHIWDGVILRYHASCWKKLLDKWGTVKIPGVWKRI